MAKIVDINLNHTLAKDVPKFGRIAPIIKDMRNYRYIDTGVTRKRPGHKENWDTTIDEPIIFLLPEDEGYAIDKAGNLIKLGASINTIMTLSPLSIRPTYVEYDGEFIIATGSVPISLINGVATPISDVPKAKIILLINDFALYVGQHPTEFISAVPGNPKNVDPAFGARTYTIQKSGTILNATDINEKAYIFKQKEIEVWDFQGGDPPFIRQPGAKIDKGLGAVNSLVRADDRRWFYGDDGDFYVIEDFNPIRISSNYTAYLNAVTNKADWDGHDIVKENVIMWNNRASGVTLLYDYRKEKWLEDNWWNAGIIEAMPFHSYMELDGRQFYGSSKYDGLIHESSYDFKDDNGSPIRVSKEITLPLSSTGVRGRVNRLNFRREANNANASVESPVFMVRTRFDNGHWSAYEHLTLGEAGDDVPNITMDGVGIGREMGLEIIATDATDFLITNIYATIERLRN